MNESVKSKDRVPLCLNGTPLGSVICPAATGQKIQIYRKHHAERWIHECRSEQDGTTGGRCQGSYTTRGHHNTLRGRSTR